MSPRVLACLAGLAAAVIFPLLAPNYLVNVAMLVFFTAFIGQSWNLAGGFAGQTSFGHVVFFGTGAYTSTILQVTYGVGIACLGAAACLLMPTYYVTPSSGHAFVLVAFTIVVLGGMGSFLGAAVGGFIIGITESLGGLLLGEQLGQIGISLIFILILLFKPTGLFGAKA